MANLFSYTTELQSEYFSKTTSSYRKQQGQVFTPPEIARFMASLLSGIPDSFSWVDPGAGLGVLSVAICERVQNLPSPRHLKACLFEPDPALVHALRKNMQYCKNELSKRGHFFEFTIMREDFVLAAASRFDGQNRFFDGIPEEDFDAVIMNPPYFKVRKNSEHANVLKKIVHGQPNAYAFFMAMAVPLLKPDGELISITPRSFCNGLYFKGFRQWFFSKMSLDHIHLFESRTEAFQDSDVLQESVIVKSHLLGKPTTLVDITESYGRRIPLKPLVTTVAYKEVLDTTRDEHLVRIPVSSEDREILRLIESQPHRFNEVGLQISTGPVVTFRAKDLVLREPDGHSVVPLLMPHNIRPFRTKWPVAHKKHPVYVVDCEMSRKSKLLIRTKNYVLLKRFTSKEEKRRLTAACLLRKEEKTEYIGLENHLNYIYHIDRDLTIDETFGIAAVFNSVLLDRYFRILSGNTQVNATEIRNLHFPAMDILAGIGEEVRALNKLSPTEVEEIVLRAFGVKQTFIEQKMVVA